MKDINLLIPSCQIKCKEFLSKCKDLGHDVRITSTLRTKEEQNTLYAKGRTASGNIVTNAEYPYSMHNWGIAFDFAYFLNGNLTWTTKYYDMIGLIGLSVGLEWGGNWKFVDKPHFQLKGYNSINDLINKYGTPDNFIKQMNKSNITPSLKFIDKESIPLVIIDNETYAKLNQVLPYLNLPYSWNNQTKKVDILNKGSISVRLINNESYVKINVLLPFLGLKYIWIPETKTVQIIN